MFFCFRRHTAKKEKTGFTLLETLVAIAVFSMAILGPLSLGISSISSINRSREQTVAFYLTEEALEFVRNKRDSNSLSGKSWLDGLNQCYGASGCYLRTYEQDFIACGASCPLLKFDSSNGLYQHNYGTDTIFRRKINIEKIGGVPYEAIVTVTISWTLKNGVNRSFSAKVHMFDWKTGK